MEGVKKNEISKLCPILFPREGWIKPIKTIDIFPDI